MNGWMYYQTETLAVVPYMPGTPVYRDGVLPDLYRWTRTEGKVAQTFCGDDLNMDQFVAFFERRKTMQVLCDVEENKDLKPVGYCWVDMPKGVDGARSAMCGFCFFKWGRRSILDLARLGVAYWFEDLRIDTLHGVQVESNEAAERFAERLGFKACSLIPDYHYYEGRLVPARVMYLRKADFWPGFEEWYSQQKAVEIPALVS